MRSSLFVHVAVLTTIAGFACTEKQAAAQVTAPVFDYNNSLTIYIARTKSPVQNLRPAFVQRGVDYDGTPRGLTPYGMSIAADSLGGGSTAWRRLGDIDLATGTYAPNDVDLSFPTLGVPVVIGRTYGMAQEDYDLEGRYDSNGIMGTNWSQFAQPELVFYDADSNSATRGSSDLIYLVYGADRYIELKRYATNNDTFKAKNGAAGVAVVAPDGTYGDEVRFIDTRGTTYTFFGFNNGTASGQLWKIVDAAGNTLVVNNATKATAISDYTGNGGRIQDVTDAFGRVYAFTYTTVGGVSRLSQVNATVDSTTVGTVDYGYYTSDETGKGTIGDLKMVTISLPATSGTLIRKKYYRYYDDVYSNTDGRRGNDRAIKMVVGFEGVRAYGAGNLDSATDAQLKPYAEAYFEYPDSVPQISSAFFNGECGCSGGTNGVYTLSFDLSSGYTYYTTTNLIYDTGWATRAVIAQPDGKYQTIYFDEAGQAMSKVLTSGDPSGTPAKKWLHQMVRNSAGQVTEIRSPEAMGSYTHSSGSLSLNGSGTGQITTFTRVSSGNLTGLRTGTAVKNGSGGSPITLSSLTVSERQLEVGSSGISLPNITASTSYPNGGGGLTTTITIDPSTGWWSGTATDPLYLAPKIVTVTSPAVTSGNNGSGTGVAFTRYHRTDGSVAYSTDASGIVSYSRRDGQGRVDRQISDVNISSVWDLDMGNDDPSFWGVSSSGTPIHAVTTMTYDQQGRMLTGQSPSVNGTRTAAMAYVVQGDGQMATFSFPKLDSGNYHGPASISVTNHASKPVRSAVIKITTPTPSLPSTTPGSDWSQMVEQTYDSAGVKLLSSKAFHTATGATGDTTTFAYDDMGRRASVTDPTGTIRFTEYEDRGMPIESWIGTSSGNKTLTDKTEYDNNSSTGGGNGYATKRIQDADGDWTGTTGDQRVSETKYDWRGRAIVQINPASPHSVMKYDDLGRVIATGQYSASGSLTASTDPTSTSGSRIGLSETVYDERGQVARTTLHEINQSTGASADTIVTDNWYDASGRMVKTAGAQIGQLVQVKLVGSATVAANYTYNALGHRNSEQTDRNDSTDNGIADGVVDGYDPVFFIATDLQGRRVATFRGTDTYAKECFAYHAPNGFGKAGAMGPMLRTRNSELTAKPDKWAVSTAPSTHDERAYYTSDFRGNVTAIVSSGGTLLEQYRYSATGVPMGIPQGDVNGDGKVECFTGGDPDYDQINYLDVNNLYAVRADLNMDGDVDYTDLSIAGAMDGVETGRKVMSAAVVGNEHGAKGGVLFRAHSVTAGRGNWEILGRADLLGSPVIRAQDPTREPSPRSIPALSPIDPLDQPALPSDFPESPDWLPPAGGPNLPFPVCVALDMDGPCERWARQMCANRGGARRSQRCYEECVKSAKYCCMFPSPYTSGDSCEFRMFYSANREVPCTQAGVKAMASCNASNFDGKCMSECMGQMKSVCAMPCGMCDSITTLPAGGGALAACLIGCALFPGPSYPACLATCLAGSAVSGAAGCAACWACQHEWARGCSQMCGARPIYPIP